MFGDDGRCFIIYRISCVTALVSTVDFIPIHQCCTFCLILKIKSADFSSGERFLFGVLHSTTHLVCIGYFYCHQEGNVADYLSINRQGEVRDRFPLAFTDQCFRKQMETIKNFRGRNSFLPRYLSSSQTANLSLYGPMKRHYYILFLFLFPFFCAIPSYQLTLSNKLYFSKMIYFQQPVTTVFNYISFS